MPRRASTTIWTALALLALLARPAAAQVKREPEFEDLGSDAAAALGGVGLLAAVVFGSADMVHGSSGRWLPPGWAWSQLGGAALNAASGALVLAYDDRPGLAIANFTLAAWFATHALLSLWRYRPSDAPPERRRVNVTVAPAGLSVRTLF